MLKGPTFSLERVIIPAKSVGITYISSFTVIDSLHVPTAGPYYSLYPLDHSSQIYVEQLRSSGQTSNRVRQRATDEEGMSWTSPPAFPPRGNSVSGHGTRQSEELHHRVFPVSTDGYRVPTSVIASDADTYSTDGYSPVDKTQYHSLYQAEQSAQQPPVGPTILVSEVHFSSVDIYADLAIDPGLDAANDVPIKGMQSGVATDEPAVEEHRVDLPGTASEEPEEVGVVEELVEIPVIEVSFVFRAVCNPGGLL
jgi:hypothetical protein